MISSQDKYLAGIVTGEQSLTAEQFDCCVREGLMPMVAKVERGLKVELKQMKHEAVATELAHYRVVKKLLDELGEVGIDCLVFKGTALAYSLYEQPWHRSRGDTDLLIRERDVDAAFSVLKRLDFQQQVSLPGRIAVGECAFEGTDGFGLAHSIDLHWRFNNNWMLTRATDFEELWRDKIPLPDISSHAWTCTTSFALMIACVHRGAHMRDVAYEIGGFSRLDSDFTLWLYDIHLLSGSLSESDWERWCTRVIDRGFSKFAISGLERSKALFDTLIPVFVMSDLREAQNQHRMELMNGRMSSEWQSFRALDSRLKLGFIKQQLFPDATYMRERYKDIPLPMAYLKRLLSGLLKRVS